MVCPGMEEYHSSVLRPDVVSVFLQEALPAATSSVHPLSTHTEYCFEPTGAGPVRLTLAKGQDMRSVWSLQSIGYVQSTCLSREPRFGIVLLSHSDLIQTTFFFAFSFHVCHNAYPLLLNRTPCRSYDGPLSRPYRVLLATALVWWAAPPLCAPAQIAAVVAGMPAVEVLGAVPEQGQDNSDYPFKTLLYESSSDMHLKKVHFEDLVPGTMTAACGVRSGSTPGPTIIIF